MATNAPQPQPPTDSSKTKTAAATTTTTTKLIFKAEIMVCDKDIYSTFDMVQENRLGSGMSGTVVRASFEDDENDKRALKIFARDRKSRFLFKAEAAILQKLNHPHIITDVLAFSCPDNYVICMPYYDRGSLRQDLQNMTLSRALKYFVQVTGAVRYLHVLGIAHRDIKPHNVLMTVTDDVMLIDFGLACLASASKSHPIHMAGTKGYMAPELFADRDDVDLFKCDLYAHGVLFWNLLFQSAVIPGTDLLSSVRENKIKLPQMFRDILENLLEPNPKDRWNDVQLINNLALFPEIREMTEAVWEYGKE